MRTDVGLLHAALVRAHVMAHAVLALEALLADVAGEGLLVRVREPVPVQMVHVSEGFAAGLAGVVLAHWVLVYGPLRRDGRQSDTGLFSVSGLYTVILNPSHYLLDLIFRAKCMLFTLF